MRLVLLLGVHCPHTGYAELINWYQNQAAGFAKIDPGCPIAEILETEAEIAQDYANEKGLDHQPYSHPFHWAGFTLTGKVPSEP